MRLDLSGLTTLGFPHSASSTIDVGAAVSIRDVEKALEQSGLTLGPLSPSVREGTVATWVEGAHGALRAIPGGRLEPAVLAMEVALRSGSLYRSKAAPRSAAGPDLDHLFLAGQGRLGLLAAATLRAFPLPGYRQAAEALLSDSAQLVRVLRSALAHDALPATGAVGREGTRLRLQVGYEGFRYRVVRDVEALRAAVIREGGEVATASAPQAGPHGAEHEVDWEALPAALELTAARGAHLFRLARESVVLCTSTPLAGDGIAPLSARTLPPTWLESIRLGGHPWRTDAMSEPMPPVSDHRRAYAYCASCPKLCRFSCPVSESERRETVTPWGKMNVGHQLATESRPLDASAVDAAYACSGCMRCTSHCRHGTDVATALVAVRSKAAHDGLLPEPIQKLRTRFQTHGSPFASPLPQLSKSAGAVTGGAYFPGCTALAKEPAMVGQALRSAQKVGAHLSLSPAAGHCCGYPLYAAGLLEEFAQHAKRFVEQTSGPLTVGDPGCAFTFMKLYPQVGVPSPADRLWVDVVADRLRNGVDGAPVEQSLGWHESLSPRARPGTL